MKGHMEIGREETVEQQLSKFLFDRYGPDAEKNGHRYLHLTRVLERARKGDLILITWTYQNGGIEEHMTLGMLTDAQPLQFVSGSCMLPIMIHVTTKVGESDFFPAMHAYELPSEEFEVRTHKDLETWFEERKLQVFLGRFKRLLATECADTIPTT